MPNGIIISTQTPVPGQTFPRPGGTASVLNHVTELAVIPMHRDALARDAEKVELGQIHTGGVVYITGHGRSEASSLEGAYTSPDPDVDDMDMQWSLQQYRDLIVDNSTLQAGDQLTIVLWACRSGDGGSESTAAHLAALFGEKGISTRIIASVDLMDRFDGVLTPGEQAGNNLSFRTRSPETVRIFDYDAPSRKLTETLNDGPIVFQKDHIEGIKPITEKSAAALQKELVRSPIYKPLLRSPADVQQYFVQNPSASFVMRPSSRGQPGYTTFTISGIAAPGSSKVANHRFVISPEGGLRSCSGEDKLGPLMQVPAGQPLADFMVNHFRTLQQQSPAQPAPQQATRARRQAPPSSSMSSAASSSSADMIESARDIQNRFKDAVKVDTFGSQVKQALHHTMMECSVKPITENEAGFMKEYLTDMSRAMYGTTLVDPRIDESDRKALAIRWLAESRENNFADDSPVDKLLAQKLVSALVNTAVTEKNFSEKLDTLISTVAPRPHSR